MCNSSLVLAINQVLAEKEDLFLVSSKLKGKGQFKKLEVIIDGDRPVKITDCSEISKKIEEQIESHQLVEGNYTLQVSSSGLENPLQLPRQYQRHKGKTLKLLCQNGKEEKGILLDASEKGISLNINNDETYFDFQYIQKAFVEITY